MNVKDAQKWLNDNFGSSVGWVEIDEDGVAGYNTMVAFVRALQILLRIDVDGGFGNGTKQAYNNLFGDGLSEINNADNNFTVKMVISLVNLALLCRIEVSNTDDISVFSEATRQGITSTMSQLGIDNYTGGLRAREIKALFTSDAYYLISSGDATTREIQQAMNKEYSDMLDNYIATNGLYDRNMNAAIIKMIQYEIGTDIDGGWGEGTMSSLPVLGPGSSNTNLVYILQYLLYLNGFDPNGFDGEFGNGVTTALKNFQELMQLDVDGYCGRQAWSALVVSCGDTTRSANACDTRFEITAERAQLLKNNGYNIVGRYINGGDFKELRDNELQTIFNAGLKVFFIYQDNNRQLSDFGYENGYNAGTEAIECAKEHHIPENSVIYFAVDMDVYEEDIDEYIVPFFKGINDVLRFKYRVGIYGPREVCSRVSANGYSISSFVADMSSGYSCNVGKKIPSDWNYDQFKEISDFGGLLDIDKVTYRGLIPACDTEESNYALEENEEVLQFLERVYNYADEYSKLYGGVGEIINPVQHNNLLVLQYLRQGRYDGMAWATVAGEPIDGVWTTYIGSKSDADKNNKKVYLHNGKNIDLPHLAVVLETNIVRKATSGIPKMVITDLAGWAGDLVSLASELDAKYPQEELSVEELMEKIGDSENFGYDDLIQDIDALNIFTALNTKPIYTVFRDYYNTSKSITRFTRFINNFKGRTGMTQEEIDTISSYEYLKSNAFLYLYRAGDLTDKILELGLDFFFGDYDKEKWSEKLAEAFAKQILNLASQEN